VENGKMIKKKKEPRNKPRISKRTTSKVNWA